MTKKTPQEKTRDQLKSHWRRIAARLRAELGEDLYTSWFARIEPEYLEENQLTVSVPTRFLRNWLESHYADRLKEACRKDFPDIESVKIKIRSHGQPVRAAAAPRPLAGAGIMADGNGAMAAGGKTGSDCGSTLDHELTFESFVLGSSNALAHAAALRVADAAPGAPVSFNPLVIHSAAGLGKTHLLNAISWRIRERHPDRNVLYITAERFMYHFMAALKKKDVLSFKDYFQSIDVLLIDDFQFLQGKSMQQEFCHTFNSLVDSKRHVVVAADLPPAQLESIDQRMRSRLAGGLVVDIARPDLELRRAIVRVRMQDAQRREPTLMFSDDVIEFIANRFTGGGRELVGALNRLIASHQLNRAPMTVDSTANALRDLAQNKDVARVRIDDIQKVVGRHYNVTRADLLSPRRARSIVIPRQIGMYLAKKMTTRSLPEIGKRFGGRDHSTVLHAVRKIENNITSDEQLHREVNLLIRLIEQHDA